LAKNFIPARVVRCSGLSKPLPFTSPLGFWLRPWSDIVFGFLFRLSFFSPPFLGSVVAGSPSVEGAPLSYRDTFRPCYSPESLLIGIPFFFQERCWSTFRLLNPRPPHVRSRDLLLPHTPQRGTACSTLPVSLPPGLCLHPPGR